MSVQALEVKNLATVLNGEGGEVRVLDRISFKVPQGKTLGIVGESGAGKSMTALSIMGLIEPSIGKIVEGEVWLGNTDLCKLTEDEMKAVRGDQMAMIFQEPMSCLNPVVTVGDQVKEILFLKRDMSEEEAHQECLHLFDRVGIPAAKQRINEYPFQLSGGMCQRVMIAMALACRPSVLIADEPTTALDVTIQAQVLELIKELQREFQMSLIMITHDLGVVAETCDEVAVMYTGKVVEHAKVHDLFQSPSHPYTYGLLEAVASLYNQKTKNELQFIQGHMPVLGQLPVGCNFQDRCQNVQPHCRTAKGEPTLTEHTEGHQVACNYPIQTS